MEVGRRKSGGCCVALSTLEEHVMTRSNAVLLCGSALLLGATATPVGGQLPRDKVAAPKGELGSSPGCQRRSVGYDLLDQELNAASQNASCLTYVRLAP